MSPLDCVRASETGRVLLYSTQVGWGGGEEQARLIVRGLLARGYRVICAAPAGSALAQRLQQMDYTVAELPGRGRGLTAWLTLRKVLAWFSPQILFMNDPHAILHGCVASLGYPVLRVGARRTVFRLRSGWLYRQWLDALVCSSQASAEACRSAGIAEQRLAVVYDGVDMTRIAAANRDRGRVAIAEILRAGRARNRGEDGDPSLDCAAQSDPVTVRRIIVQVGKLTPAKGQQDLLAAFAELAKRFPDVSLIFLGDGELRGVLESRVKELGLTDRVFLPGFRRDVLDIVAAADAFAFPSRQEGLGGSLIEAMLLGVPVVASRSGGIPEVLQDDEAEAPLGLLVPPGDVPALREALGHLLGLSEEERNDMVRRARTSAERRFADASMTAQLVQQLDLWLAERQ